MAAVTNASNEDAVFLGPSEMWILDAVIVFCWSRVQWATSSNHMMLCPGPDCILLPKYCGEGCWGTLHSDHSIERLAQMGYEEPETTELWFNKFSSKGDYEPNHVILCYINELCFDQVKGVWREGEVEERKKGRKRLRECLAWALAEGTKAKVCMDPLIPVQVSRPLKMQSLLPLSSHLCFHFCSCGLES